MLSVRQILLSFLKHDLAAGCMKKKVKEEKKLTFHPAPRQPLDLLVEVLMGVRCAPNQRNMAGNVSEQRQREMALQEL